MQKNGGLLMVAMLAALCLFSLRDNTQAQFGPKADQPNDAAMEATARAAQASIDSGDYESLFKLLAPWMQETTQLMHDTAMASLGTNADDDADVKAQAGSLDPGNKLGVDSVARLKALSTPEFFGLVSGMLQYAHGQKAGKWYMVSLGEGLFEERRSRNNVLGWGITVVFQRVDSSMLTVSLRSFNGEFRVADFGIYVEGEDRLILSETVSPGGSKASGMFGSSARVAEGEQLLGSARDWSRVQYSKTGTAPAKLEDPDQWEGKYYSVLEDIHLIGDARAALVAQPKKASGRWLLIEFKWASGDTTITQFANKAELDKALGDRKLRAQPK